MCGLWWFGGVWIGIWHVGCVQILKTMKDLIKARVSIYQRMERFAWLTMQALQEGNAMGVKRCLGVAERLLVGGSLEVRNAVANGYLYTVSTFMEARRMALNGVLPPSLLREYERQINAHGV